MILRIKGNVSLIGFFKGVRDSWGFGEKLDLEDFCNGLNINPSQIYTYLIDKKGEILFFVAGRFSDKKGDDLLSVIKKLND